MVGSVWRLEREVVRKNWYCFLCHNKIGVLHYKERYYFVDLPVRSRPPRPSLSEAPRFVSPRRTRPTTGPQGGLVVLNY